MERDVAIKLVQDVILEHAFMSAKEYTLDSNLKKLGIDSLDLVELGMLVEERLKIPFNKILSRTFTGIETVGDLVKLVESL